MSILDDVISSIRTNSEIPRRNIYNWMKNEDMEILGAVCYLIHDERCEPRITPPLSLDRYLAFIMNYYGRCFRENPDGEWSENRYDAGAAFVRLFVHLWKDKSIPRDEVKNLKNWIAEIYKTGDDKIKECLLFATFEHLFEPEDIADYFSDWKTDRLLKHVYDEALCFAKGFRDIHKKKPHLRPDYL